MEQINRPKLIAFHAHAQNVGKSTLSQSFARTLADSNKKVLFVEADFLNPTFHYSTGLSHETKNFYELVKVEKEYNITDFIARKIDFLSSDIDSTFPDTLSLLTIPSYFEEMNQPEIQSKEKFVQKFIEILKNLDVDYIIINAPSNITNLFSYPLLVSADTIITIFNSKPSNVISYRKQLDFLRDRNLLIPGNNIYLLNMTNKSSIKLAEIEGEKVLGKAVTGVIPFDEKRSSYEWQLKWGSPIINEAMVALIQELKLSDDVKITKEKRGLFKKF